jgi:maltose alpha-D-glucosyltransferase/alpha-amylase
VADQLEAPDSQLHQVKQLIALRQAHPALQNRSGIRFLRDGTPGMPLVYERFCEQEQLLIVLNPGKEAVSFPYDKTLGEAVYTFGSPALQENGTVTAAPISAGIYKIR